MLKVGIIAGEASGDQLGAALIAALREIAGDVDVEGLAGPRMVAAGCRPLAGIDELSVLGIVEVLRHYPRLWRLRERLIRHFIASPPDVFVGIDVPDFVLNVESRLRAAGIPTVHYVCPQVWVWRQHRIPGIRRAIDVLLAVFPFEVGFFARFGITARFVGHSMADALPSVPDPAAARAALGLPAEGRIVALMPGSRSQEIARLTDLFLDAAVRVRAAEPAVRFIAGVVNPARAAALLARRDAVAPGLPLEVYSARSPEVLTAADAALVASGTVTLEAMLCHTPLVVAYRMAPLSFRIIKAASKSRFVAIPNILAGEAVVPEFLQNDARPAALADGLLHWLRSAAAVERYRAYCTATSATLRNDAARAAARAIVDLVHERAAAGRP